MTYLYMYLQDSVKQTNVCNLVPMSPGNDILETNFGQYEGRLLEKGRLLE